MLQTMTKVARLSVCKEITLQIAKMKRSPFIRTRVSSGTSQSRGRHFPFACATSYNVPERYRGKGPTRNWLKKREIEREKNTKRQARTSQACANQSPQPMMTHRHRTLCFISWRLQTSYSTLSLSLSLLVQKPFTVSLRATAASCGQRARIRRRGKARAKREPANYAKCARVLGRSVRGNRSSGLLPCRRKNGLCLGQKHGKNPRVERQRKEEGWRRLQKLGKKAACAPQMRLSRG